MEAIKSLISSQSEFFKDLAIDALMLALAFGVSSASLVKLTGKGVTCGTAEISAPREAK